MSFANATASYFALHELLAPRPHEVRTARLLVEVRGLSGKAYTPGTEVRVLGDGERIDGFVYGDRLTLRPRDFEAAS